MRLVLQKKKRHSRLSSKVHYGLFSMPSKWKILKFLGKIALFSGSPTPPLFKKAALTSPPSLQALMRADSFPP